MSDIALKVENLSKRYRLGLPGAASSGMYRYKSLRDTFGRLARRPLQTARGALAGAPITADNSFWALDDVSFEVKRGEVVGIVGRNGAGKSTLLKILSRITKPTDGRVDLFGRVGSLLEVGTGFHPELSGRENIYLNAAILGMTRAEVRGKFDEIVAFSEVERFLDTPVKQYSSGMYMRLAFSVAAHLDPEILVVDEVLAVGDAAFQSKCLGKMKDVADQGRTVLFVSHNVSALLNLCPRSLLLQKGCLIQAGPTSSVVQSYIEGTKARHNATDDRRQLTPNLEVDHITINPPMLTCCDDAELSLRITVKRDEELISHLCVLIYSVAGTRVAIVDLRARAGTYRIASGQALEINASLRQVSLVEGDYSLGLYLVSSSCGGNFLDLNSFTITAKPNITGVPYYPIDARGTTHIDLVSLPTVEIFRVGRL